MTIRCHCEGMNRSRTDILIRRADVSDARALWRLAALDDAPAPRPRGDVLIAEIDGEIVAAHSADRSISDPFRPTAAVVDLLRLRAEQLGALVPTATAVSAAAGRPLLRPHAAA